MEKPLKPAAFAEQKILNAILNSTYKPGEPLPAERALAQLLGVTRPTLRETLQRLSKEGWVIIQHGKPTMVNDYINNGGLGILASLAKYGQHLSTDLVAHLLEVRTTMFPDIAQKAVLNELNIILDYLLTSEKLNGHPNDFALYDWRLQILMVKATKNPVFNMILNDFAPLYGILGKVYFQHKEARDASMNYYKDLISALTKKDVDIKKIVEKMMIQTQIIWKSIQ
jgi:GntR family transcriptional regulator, negative regulator for fad regulon and positive regulator of fabA